jgi:hypothetical protein
LPWLVRLLNTAEIQQAQEKGIAMSQTEATKKLIEEIRKGWRSFDEALIDQYNDDVLIALVENGKTFIHRLPQHLKTDPVLSVIAELDKTNQCMKYISQGSTPIYRELAVKAVASSYGNLRHVAEDIVDAGFVRDTVAMRASSLCAFFEQYPALVHEIYSTAEMEAVLCADTIARNQVVNDFLRGKFETPLITDAFIQQSLLVCNNLVGFLLKTEKKHLALDLIKQGEWPEKYANDKPSDLKDAVKRMMKVKNSTAQEWQKAYAMTFGIAEVVKVMKTPSRIELLEAIYSKEEILPFLSKGKDMKIKGQWLEDALGL